MRYQLALRQCTVLFDSMAQIHSRQFYHLLFTLPLPWPNF